MDFPFRKQAFQISFFVSCGLLLLSFVLAAWHGSWLAALLIGVPAWLVPALLYRTVGNQLVSRVAYGCSYMLFCALHIHQSSGMTELHFGIFVLLALLIAFRDWLVIACAAAFIAVHHLLFLWLQLQGHAVYVLPTLDLSISIVLIHAGYVVAEALVLMLICHHSLKEAQQAQFFMQTTSEMQDQQGRIHLQFRQPTIQTRLTSKFCHVLTSLQATVALIDASAARLTDETSQLVQEGLTLTDRIDHKMREVARIAAATGQLSASSRDLVELATQVLMLAEQSSAAAGEGQATVARTIAVVDELSETLTGAREQVHQMAMSTKEIQHVLDVIQQIAEQTNLLALNAAIEAARAGEQGRGFAVVADEVRTLASRTHSSTVEIRQMIHRLVQNSAGSVAAVEQSLLKLTATVEIAGRSKSQIQLISTQVQQVLHSVNQMSSTLQQQGLASAEIAKSTSELSELAAEQQLQGRKVTDIAHHVEEISSQLKQEAEHFVLADATVRSR